MAMGTMTRVYKAKPRKAVKKQQSATVKANKALTIAKKLQRSRELKFIGGHELYNINWSGVVLPIGRNSRGVGNNEHIGSIIRPTSARINIDFTSAVDCRIRVLCFLWKEDYYPATSAGGAGAIDANLFQDYYQDEKMISFKSDMNKTLSKWIYDKTITLSAGTSLKKTVKIVLKNLPTMVYADSDATTYLKKNGLYIALMSDVDSIAVDQPSCEYYSRLYFYDD